MKKVLLFLMSVILFTACSCNNSQKDVIEPAKVDTTEVALTAIAMDVDHIIATDRQAMFMKFGDNYRWYETEILLPYFLDSDSVTSNPEMLVNIFQSVIEFDNGADTYVWKFQHFADGTLVVDSIHGFWIENWPLNEEILSLNYEKAWNKMMATNYPKPHSKHVTLRNPVGPVYVNTQWIFGNIREQIWVDAVTGECKNSNPAFPEEKGFKMPLGEWP